MNAVQWQALLGPLYLSPVYTGSYSLLHDLDLFPICSGNGVRVIKLAGVGVPLPTTLRFFVVGPSLVRSYRVIVLWRIGIC